MRNTRHMTYNTRHVQLNSHKQKDRCPDSRKDERRQKHHTCNMQPTSQTIRDVRGSFHRGLPLTCGVDPFPFPTAPVRDEGCTLDFQDFEDWTSRLDFWTSRLDFLVFRPSRGGFWSHFGAQNVSKIAFLSEKRDFVERAPNTVPAEQNRGSTPPEILQNR